MTTTTKTRTRTERRLLAQMRGHALDIIDEVQGCCALTAAQVRHLCGRAERRWHGLRKGVAR